MSITVDHCVWVTLIDKDKSESKMQAAQESEQLLDYCLKNEIDIYLSTRIRNWDAVAMSDVADHERLEALISKYQAHETSAGFRLGDAPDPLTGNSGLVGSRGSVFGSADMLVDHFSLCRKNQAFQSIFDIDPIDRHPNAMGSKLPNWIGDYDALKGHFMAGHGVFVTLDTGVPCFDSKSRQKALKLLELRINSPQEALTFLKSLNL